jgi:hypothetical protein
VRPRRRPAPSSARRCSPHSSALRVGALVGGAEQALLAGDLDRARRLAAGAERCTPDDDVRQAAVVVQAHATAVQGDPTSAYHRLRAALDDARPLSPAVAARSCVEAAVLALQVVPADAAALADRAVGLAEQQPGEALRSAASLTRCLAQAMTGDRECAGELAARVQSALLRRGAAQPRHRAAVVRHHGDARCGLSEQTMQVVNAVGRRVRDAQALGVMPQVLLARAEVENVLNRYADAWASTSEAALLAEHLGQRRRPA